MTTETVELTIEQKMELAIAKAKESRKKVKDEAKLALINNGKYVDYLASVEDEQDQIKHLQGIMDQLNKIKPITTNDGTDYKVHVYPVAEYVFGPVMSRVIGIVTGSSAMFTDERQAEFEAITNMSYLTATNARVALGSPAYYSKGNFVDELPSDTSDNIHTVVTAVCDALTVDVSYANKVNTSAIERWFATAKAKAEKQYGAFKKVESVDATNNFTLED